MRIRGIVGAGLAAFIIATLTPAEPSRAAGRDLTPTIIPPTLTGTPLVREGYRRYVTIRHTCRAKHCDIRIFTRPGTALLNEDYRFSFKRPGRFLYQRGKQFKIRVAVDAFADHTSEPREALTMYADLRASDGQRIEGRKTVYILSQP